MLFSEMSIGLLNSGPYKTYSYFCHKICDNSCEIKSLMTRDHFIVIKLYQSLFAYWNCCSVTQLYLTLCSSINCSMPGFSNSCPLSWWCYTISHSLLPAFPPTLNPSWHQDLSQWVSSSVSCGQNNRASASASASVLPMNIQGWFPLGLIGLIFLLRKGLSGVFSSIIVKNH